MNKILIIGAGIGQVELLKKAKESGAWVAVVSRQGDYPCIGMADGFCPFDIYDRERIVEWAKTNRISAVVSDQNDLTMPTVAYVATKLGIPGNDFDVVLSYCNKNRFRGMCEDVGVPVPHHIKLKDSAVPESFKVVPLPWIVKPEDSQSSIGVTKINSLSEFKTASKLAIEKSRNKTAILEEFFTGREIVCEGMVCNGQYYHLAFGDRRYFDLPNLMIPSQTIFPSNLQQKYLDRVVRYETDISQRAGLEFSILHSEYLVDDESGEIRIVETGPRGGGVYISSHLIPAATGIDITELLLRYSCGETIDMNAVAAQRKDGASAYVCFYLPVGEIMSVSGVDEIKAHPNVIAAYLDGLEVGAQTETMLYKGARKGPILLKGASRSEVEDLISYVQSTLHIKVRMRDGRLGGVIWG